MIDVEDAIAPGARLLHPDWKDYNVALPVVRDGNVSWQVTLERGDVEAAFRGAHAVVEDEFRAPRQIQTPIEPHVAVVRYEDGRYVVTTPTQYPFLVRERVAEFLGLHGSDVRVIVPTIGGGFGGKIDAVLEPIAAILARKSGRPVRLANTRQEEQATTGPREDGIIRLRTAVAADGTILAHDGRGAAQRRRLPRRGVADGRGAGHRLRRDLPPPVRPLRRPRDLHEPGLRRAATAASPGCSASSRWSRTSTTWPSRSGWTGARSGCATCCARASTWSTARSSSTPGSRRASSASRRSRRGPS